VVFGLPTLHVPSGVHVRAVIGITALYKYKVLVLVQTRIMDGLGPRHCTTACPSVSHLSPSYTENKYVKRVTLFFFMYLNQVKYNTVRSLREIDVLVQKSTV